MVDITINRQRVQTVEGTTVLKAAQENNFFIPTFCYDEDLQPYGACRMCLVSITYKDGSKKIVTSCDTYVEDGMVILTDTDEVVDAQADTADFLLSLCPNLPSVQKLAEGYGIHESTYISENKKENCILCGQCVRACHTKGKGVIDFMGRGDERIVSTFDGKHSDACDTCTACIPYCPTGAVVNGLGLGIGWGFKKKTWSNVRNRQFFNKLFLALFVILMLMTAVGITIPFIPNNFFSLADPFQALMTLFSGKEPIRNYWPSLITVGLTIIFGRFWCGWVCPTGTILHLYGKKGRRIKAQNLRRVKYIILFVLIILALLGSLAFLWLDPITMLIQSVFTIIKPSSEYLSQGYLDSFRFLGVFWWLAVLPMLCALILNFIEKRFWCRYICPLGAMLGLLSKFAPKKRHVDQKACSICGECPKSCPVGAIDADNGYRSDPGECIMCLTCAHNCPSCAITFSGERIFQLGNRFDPGKREFFGTLIAGAAAVGLMTFEKRTVDAESSSVLRPPGSLRKGESAPDTFLSLCTRCNQCVLTCPQNIIKPSILESGWSGFSTPMIEFNGGFCDPKCNRCGIVCPSGAIPHFNISEKVREKIGLAHVYYPECTRCYLCVQTCPNQAFEEVTIEGKRGIYPQVINDKCSGCGACLAVCPLFDDGAINEYPTSKVPDDNQFNVKPVPETERTFKTRYYSKIP
ncbi:MAG: 4Fe-4S dicluster domain-containing protein [Flexilinea sp.]